MKALKSVKEAYIRALLSHCNKCRKVGFWHNHINLGSYKWLEKDHHFVVTDLETAAFGDLYVPMKDSIFPSSIYASAEIHLQGCCPYISFEHSYDTCSLAIVFFNILAGQNDKKSFSDTMSSVFSEMKLSLPLDQKSFCLPVFPWDTLHGD